MWREFGPRPALSRQGVNWGHRLWRQSFASRMPTPRRSPRLRHGQNRSFDSAKTIKVRIVVNPTAISTRKARADGGFPVTAS